MKSWVVLISIMLIAMSSSAIPQNIGVNVQIEWPEDGAIFHHRNVSIRCFASACCGDRLVYWEWKWTWSNGSYSESGELDFLTKYEFTINVSLYPDWNTIEVIVKSNRDWVAHDSITIYYDGPLAITNGPYQGETGEKIKFIGSAYGGIGPYAWLWNFGDGNISYEKEPEHVYNEPGTYKVSLTVFDIRGYNDTAYTWAYIGEDKIPPMIKIITPSNGIYINGKKIFPSPIPIIIGDLIAEVEAKDNETNITKVEFYLDDILIANDSIAPYTCELKNITGVHEIKAIAYDIAMNSASDSMKFFAFKP